MTPREGERLASIEAILIRVETKLTNIEIAQNKDIADLAALKNKGAGIMIGVALGAAALGAGIKAIILGIVQAFK